jgi:hypothetical protein
MRLLSRQFRVHHVRDAPPFIRHLCSEPRDRLCAPVATTKVYIERIRKKLMQHLTRFSGSSGLARERLDVVPVNFHAANAIVRHPSSHRCRDKFAERNAGRKTPLAAINRPPFRTKYFAWMTRDPGRFEPLAKKITPCPHRRRDDISRGRQSDRRHGHAAFLNFAGPANSPICDVAVTPGACEKALVPARRTR